MPLYANRPIMAVNRHSPDSGVIAATTNNEMIPEAGGYPAFMYAVAKKAGVSKQTVYSHFANKEALFKTCIDNKVKSYGLNEVRLPENSDVGSALLSIIENFVNLLLDPEVVAMHRVVMAEAGKHPDMAKLFFELGPAKTLSDIGNFLQKEVQRGELTIADDRIEYAIVQLTNMSIGKYQFQMMLRLIDRVDEQVLQRHLARVVDDFLKLYQTRSGETAGMVDAQPPGSLS